MRRTLHSRRRLLVAGLQSTGAFALLGGLPAMRSALAAGPAPPADPAAVALAFDRSSQSLYRVSGKEVSRHDEGAQQWTALELPPTKAPHEIASVGVAAGDNAILYVAGRGFGVLASDDGGRSWSARNEGLAGTDVTALATHADRPGTVYAYIAGSGIFRSEDDGRRWRLMDAGPRGGITRFVHSNMAGSMQSGWLFAAGPRGVSRAMDCFCGWRDAGELKRAAHAVACDPGHPAHVYAATGTELVFSSDGGQAWSRVDAPAPQVRALVVGPGGSLYAAGAEGSLFRRVAVEAPWERLDA